MVAHGVVVADNALFLAAEDVLDLGQGRRHEGALGLFGRLGEAGVVVGQFSNAGNDDLDYTAIIKMIAGE